jgi:hypothetical protein
VIAGSPSGVAGTLIIAFGRSTSLASRMPSEMVCSVLAASSGSTSKETRPSTAFDSSNTGRRRSQAARMSSIASAS